MTEDDTFRILARPNIHQMVELHFEWKKRYVDMDYDTRQNLEFVKYHGWGWIEFLKAKKEAGYAC